MNRADLERVRTRRLGNWRPDFVCADCLGPPTTPMLEDAVWEAIWSAGAPRADRRCNCEAWERYRGPIRGHTKQQAHWQGVAPRRPLLCLECAERRFGRTLTVDDLLPCTGNYYIAKLLLTGVNPQKTS